MIENDTLLKRRIPGIIHNFPRIFSVTQHDNKMLKRMAKLSMSLIYLPYMSRRKSIIC